MPSRRCSANGSARRRLTSDMKRVVVVGGGFAGLHLIRALEHRLPGKAVDLTLVDRQNYHLFTPLLYQVATGELPPHAVAYPLRLATALAGYRFIQTEIEAIDVERHVVRTADGDLPYDHVVVAPGSVTNDYGIPGVAEHAVAMKWLADGEAVRKRVIRAFEDAAIESDAAKRKQALTFVLIGAGPVGVELASSLRDLMDHTLRRIYPTVDFDRDVTIHLLDGADRVLPSFDPRLGRIAMKRGEPAVPYVYRRKGDLIALGRTNAGAELALSGGSIVMSGLPAWTVWRGNYLLQLLGVRNRATLLMEWVLSYFSGRIVADAP